MSRQQCLALLAVGLLAFGVRCAYLWEIRGAPFFDLRTGDGATYHLWARRIADGDWIGTGVFYQAPLYPYFLALIYRVLDDSAAAVRVVQALVGAASCVLLAAAGMSLWGRRGVIAGVGLGIYPPAIFLDGLIEKAALVTFFTTALLALLARCGKRPWQAWLAAGATVGLLALTRENALVLVIPILLWIGLRRRPASALAFAAGCGLILMPIALRNLAVGGEFHLTTSQFGPNFYIGNHAGALGTYEALVTGHGSAQDEREDATRVAEQAEGRRLSPREVSQYWTSRSLDFIRSQPLAWLKLTARKFALTLNAAEVSDSESQDVYAEWSWLLRLLRPFDFGVLLGMAALGAALTIRCWPRIWFLYALMAAYALSVVAFYVFARYRFPLVPPLLLLAAGGLLSLRQSRRLLVWAAGAAVLAIAFARLPLDDPRASRATHYLNIAAALAKDPERLNMAIGFYQRALETVPQFPAAQFGMATLLARMGKPAEAIPYYRAALVSWPDYAEARHNLGMALAATGQPQEAAQEYRKALHNRPDDTETHVALGNVLLALRRPDLALEHYRQALALDAKQVKALVGSGVALTQLGRYEDAIRNYQVALAVDPSNASAHNNLGWTLASQGSITAALPHFERALELNPDYEDAKRNLDQARRMISQSK